MKKLSRLLIIGVVIFSACGTREKESSYLLSEDEFIGLETVSHEENVEFMKTPKCG